MLRLALNDAQRESSRMTERVSLLRLDRKLPFKIRDSSLGKLS
jgi:hypothetical protein